MSLGDAFRRFPTLTTERLRLRELRLTDTEAVYAIKSDAEVTRRYGEEPHRSVEETRGWVEKRLVDYERRDAIVWAFARREDDTVIGSCCFWHFDPTFRTAEIGYELCRSEWGRGIGAEGVSAAVRYGFEEMDLHRIEACPLVFNEPSRQLLLRLGFVLEGTLRERCLVRGRFEDQLYLGLLRDEWRNRTPPARP
jgi:[ribosomal protein S5]-alanine N-acetyltransferase